RILFLLFAVAVLTVLLYMQEPGSNNSAATPAQTSAPEPGFVALSAQIIETGDNGQPLYTLDAQRIAQPVPDGTIYLTSPVLHYEPAGATPWVLTAAGAAAAERAERRPLRHGRRPWYAAGFPAHDSLHDEHPTRRYAEATGHHACHGSYRLGRQPAEWPRHARRPQERRSRAVPCRQRHDPALTCTPGHASSWRCWRSHPRRTLCWQPPRRPPRTRRPRSQRRQRRRAN